jgi:cyclopropane fatty-acyl-phospholipid synthase-like methyltransferase
VIPGACPACDGVDLRHFHEESSVPAHSCLLLDTRTEAAEYPRGRIDLVFCRGCGFISNAAFDPALNEYSQRYEETQSFSPHFTAWARDLAEEWVDRFDLYGRCVLEIGCGKGEFLTMMCEAGAGQGIGIDPGTHPERIDSPAADRLTWIQDFYSDQYGFLLADAIVCRHTLEHVQPVADFVRTIRSTIADRLDTVVLFELPDVARVLREVAFWDVYYEHCSYFTAGSLARLFRASGFEVLDVRLDYDDQYLLLEARPVPHGHPPAEPLAIEEDVARLEADVDHFEAGYGQTVGRWNDELHALRGKGGRVAIWGAGSKGVAYLSALGESTAVDVAVDINPFKHGKFMAGTGQEIVEPAFLEEYDPDLVVVMNPVYIDEITRTLDELGLHPRVEAV